MAMTQRSWMRSLIGAALHMSGADVLDMVDELQERGLIEDASLDAGRLLGEVLIRLTIYGVAACEERAARSPQNF